MPNNAQFAVFFLSSTFGAVSIVSDTAFQAFFSGSMLARPIGSILPVLGRCLYEDNPDYRNRPFYHGRWSRLVRRVAVGWNFFVLPMVSLCV